MKAPVSISQAELLDLTRLDGWEFETTIYFDDEERVEGDIYRRATRNGVCITYMQRFHVEDIEDQVVEIDSMPADDYSLDGAELSSDSQNLHSLMVEMQYSEFGSALHDISDCDVLNEFEGE